MKTTVTEDQKINRYKQYLHSIQIPVRQKIKNCKNFSVEYKAILMHKQEAVFLNLRVRSFQRCTCFYYSHPQNYKQWRRPSGRDLGPGKPHHQKVQSHPHRLTLPYWGRWGRQVIFILVKYTFLSLHRDTVLGGPKSRVGGAPEKSWEIQQAHSLRPTRDS